MGSYQLIREKKDARLRWDPQQLQLGDIIVEGEGKNLSPRIEVITSDATSNLEKSPTSPLSTLPKSVGDHGGPHSHRSKTGGGSGRLLSLDIFRGITVALMIFVEYAGGIYPAINHSPWDGITLADFVMPFFLFIVGVSLALGYKNIPCRLTATGKAIHRALKLLILGLFLQGGYFHGIKNLTYGVDVERIRWMGILQRIAISFLLAAMCEIWLKGDNKVNSGQSLLKRYHQQWAMAIMVTALYLSLFYGLYVSDWEYQMPMDISSSEAKIFPLLSIEDRYIAFAIPKYRFADGEVLFRCTVVGSLRTRSGPFGAWSEGHTFIEAHAFTESLISPRSLISFLCAIGTLFFFFSHYVTTLILFSVYHQFLEYNVIFSWQVWGTRY